MAIRVRRVASRRPLNCWEVMGCGRQPGGVLEAEFGPCPVALAFDLNGVNHGHNGGRICWCVAGTLCDQSPRGTLARADLACHECRFFRRVQDEEGALDFVITTARRRLWCRGVEF